MARVSFVEKGQGHPMVEHLYRKIESQGQTVINLYKVLGHCPNIGLNVERLGSSLRKGQELSPRLRELAVLRVGDLAKSEYEFSKHSVIGLQAGLRKEQIESINKWESSPEFNEEERTVLAYADEVERDIRVKDETFARLRSFLSEHAIVELTVAIGYYGMVSRFLVALDIEVE